MRMKNKNYVIDLNADEYFMSIRSSFTEFFYLACFSLLELGARLVGQNDKIDD